MCSLLTLAPTSARAALFGRLTGVWEDNWQPAAGHVIVDFLSAVFDAREVGPRARRRCGAYTNARPSGVPPRREYDTLMCRVRLQVKEKLDDSDGACWTQTARVSKAIKTMFKCEPPPGGGGGAPASLATLHTLLAGATRRGTCGTWRASASA